MKIPVIKELAENFTISQLQAAEAAILDEQVPSIAVGGDDEGEQLTHILAAIDIIENMNRDGIPLAKAVRNYSQRVRNSIS